MLKYLFKPKFGEFDVFLWIVVTVSIYHIGWWSLLVALLGLIATAIGHLAWEKHDAAF